MNNEWMNEWMNEWESSETDPAKAWDFDDNNSWIKIFLDPFQSEERNEKWSHHRIFTSHLTWSCVFRRRQTYADVFRRVQTYSDVCRLTLTHWDVCRRTAAFNDSLHLGGQKISAVWESSETDPFKVYVFGENNSKFQKNCDRFYWEERNEKWGHHRSITSHEGEEMVANPLPPESMLKT